MAKAKGHNPTGDWQMCLVLFIQCCESSPIPYKKPDFQFLLQKQKTWQDRPESLPQRHLGGTYSPMNEEAPLPTPQSPPLAFTSSSSTDAEQVPWIWLGG